MLIEVECDAHTLLRSEFDFVHVWQRERVAIRSRDKTFSSLSLAVQFFQFILFRAPVSAQWQVVYIVLMVVFDVYSRHFQLSFFFFGEGVVQVVTSV